MPDKETKRSRGRPTKYEARFCDELVDFFSGEVYEQKTDQNGKPIYIPNKFPTMARFASRIGVHRSTLIEWCDIYPDFSDAYKRAQSLQEAWLVEGAMVGAYVGSFSIFTAKNVLGWRDKHPDEDNNQSQQPLHIVIQKDV